MLFVYGYSEVDSLCMAKVTSAGKERVNSKHEASTERAAIRMWTGGPLRQMATTKVSSAFIPYAKTINGCHFAGRYVCDGCQEPCGGISLSDVGKMSGNQPSEWLCDLCKSGQERKVHTPEQKQAVIHRLATARRNRTVTVRIQRSEEMPEICNAVAAVAADVNPNEEVYGIM